MSTAIREAALVTDDRCDVTDPTTPTTSTTPTTPTTPTTLTTPPTPVSASASRAAGSDGAPDPSPQEPANGTQAELTTMLDHCLRLLPRDLLKPVVAASCPWFAALPPAAARQCVGDVQGARVAGDVSAVLNQWRERARPFLP